MNKLFIVESTDDILLTEASLIKSYIDDETEVGQEAISQINDMSKQITKMLVATLAIIAILKVIGSAIKANKGDDKGKNNLSKSAYEELKRRNKDNVTYAGVDALTQEFEKLAEILTEANVDAKAAKTAASQAKKQRDEYLKFAKSRGLDIDNPEVKRVIKSLNKDINNAARKEANTVNNAKALWKSKSKELNDAVTAYGTPSQMEKFDTLKKAFEF